jgi:FixJ family two-component response regulator
MNSASLIGYEVSAPRIPCSVPTVFIIDDDVSVRESLQSLICHAGWQTEAFASAEQFLSHPRVMSPSCLILELHLPDLNGLDLQRRIAAERCEVPVIFITCHANVRVARASGKSSPW